tara:strand:- start:561 stop:1052 length:492 start_codon:yes stop_codon:yes gene_type:complete
MRVKRKIPISTAGPQSPSTGDEGGYKDSSAGGTQPPSVGPEQDTVEVPVGALVRYTSTHMRITFEDWQSDHAIVLDRKLFHREVVGGPQPNPDVWPLLVSMLLIQWLDNPGSYADDRWKPRAWVEDIKPGYVCKDGWEAGRGPVWVMERAGTGTGKILWEVVE